MNEINITRLKLNFFNEMQKKSGGKGYKTISRRAFETS